MREDQILKRLEELRKEIGQNFINILSEDVDEGLDELFGFGGDKEAKLAKQAEKKGQDLLYGIVKDLTSEENSYFRTIAIRAAKANKTDSQSIVTDAIESMLSQLGKRSADISAYQIKNDSGYIQFSDGADVAIAWDHVPTQKPILGNLQMYWEAEGQSGEIAIVYEADTAEKKEERAKTQKQAESGILQKIQSFGFKTIEKIQLNDGEMNIEAHVKRSIGGQSSQSGKVVWGIDIYRTDDKTLSSAKRSCDLIDSIFENVVDLYNKVYGESMKSGPKLWDSLFKADKIQQMRAMGSEEYQKQIGQAMQDVDKTSGGISNDYLLNAKANISGAILNDMIWSKEKVDRWSQNVSNLGDAITTFAHLFYFLAMTQRTTFNGVYVAIAENARILVAQDQQQESRNFGNAHMMWENVDAMKRGICWNISYKERVMLTEKSESKSQQRFMGMVYAYKNGELDTKGMNKSMLEKIKKAAEGMTKKEAKKFASTKHDDLPEKVKKEERILGDIASLREDMKKNARGVMQESISIPYTPESLREDYDPDEEDYGSDEWENPEELQPEDFDTDSDDDLDDSFDYDDSEDYDESLYEEKQMGESENEDLEDSIITCGFSISTSDGDVIKDNALDVFGYGPEDTNVSILQYFDLDKRKLTDEAWEILTQDIETLEDNLIDWIQQRYKIRMRDEGHDTYGDFIGTCWFDKSNTEAFNFVMERNEDEYADYDSVIQQSNEFDEWGSPVFKGMSQLGKKLIDVTITFFNIDKELWESWKSGK